MRNRRAILFSLALSLAFALALAALSMFGPSGAAAPGAALSSMNPDSITAVAIDRQTGDGRPMRISLARSGGKWLLDGPIKAEADSGTVRRMIDLAVFAEPRDALSLRDMETLGRSLRDFGLEEPHLAVTLIAPGRRETYLFGRDTAIGGEVYAKRLGEGPVFTVPASVARGLDRPLREFRRRNLFSLGIADIADIGLKGPGEPFSKLVRSGGGWRLSEPVDAPADKAAADGLASAICSARIVAYGRKGETMNVGLGAEEGSYAISLRSQLGVVEKVVFGLPAGTNEVWALSPEGAAVRVPAALLETCRRCQRTLEDTRVFPVDAASVTSISVSEGFPAYMLSRRAPAGRWRLVSPVDAPADPENVGLLLDRILSLRGVDVASAEPGSLAVSVGTAHTNFPVCALSGAFLPEGTRLADLRDRTLMRYPAEKVRRVRVSTAAGAEWEVRGPALRGPGDAAQGDLLALLAKGIVAEGVETVALRKEDFERYGFDRPSYSLAFELDDSESALRTLLLGAAAPGGGRFATLGGSDAAFILSAATVSALTRPEMETLREKK